MANTYTYSGPATRWATKQATTIGRLNVSRINADHLYEACNKIFSTPNSDGYLTPTITDATAGSVKDSVVFSWAPAGGNGTANQGIAQVYKMEDSAGSLDIVAREIVRQTTVTAGSEAVEWEWTGMRSGTVVTLAKLFASTRTYCLVGGDMGAGTVGPVMQVERNTNATTPTPGCLSVLDKNGTAYFLWVDTTGKVRVGTTQPGGTDTIGTVIGTQT